MKTFERVSDSAVERLTILLTVLKHLNENTSDAEHDQRAKKGVAGHPRNHLMVFVRYSLKPHAGDFGIQVESCIKTVHW